MTSTPAPGGAFCAAAWHSESCVLHAFRSVLHVVRLAWTWFRLVLHVARLALHVFTFRWHSGRPPEKGCAVALAVKPARTAATTRTRISRCWVVIILSPSSRSIVRIEIKSRVYGAMQPSTIQRER